MPIVRSENIPLHCGDDEAAKLLNSLGNKDYGRSVTAMNARTAEFMKNLASQRGRC